ncbi:hypothetical protein GDO81_021636 [Engystomops pustulosus]|uniref:Uncharacterized protein n=1 Tax=Engystomops pustulosus TaxID=76066 RepID=A0AAV6Z968_ENGPU|nr:hypothetical protein GDO81_021636 [Engystomops pustulosus]
MEQSDASQHNVIRLYSVPRRNLEHYNPQHVPNTIYSTPNMEHYHSHHYSITTLYNIGKEHYDPQHHRPLDMTIIQSIILRALQPPT